MRTDSIYENREYMRVYDNLIRKNRSLRIPLLYFYPHKTNIISCFKLVYK